MNTIPSAQKRTATLEALDRLADAIREAPAEALCSTLHELRCAPARRDYAQDLVGSMALALETALRCR